MVIWSPNEGVEAASEAVFVALAQAENAASRLDERVHCCDFREGWLARLSYAEASAWGWTSGNVVTSEDLVLHDHAMDIRVPDQTLRAAHGLVRARAKAQAAGPELASIAGLKWLAGSAKDPPKAEGFVLPRSIDPDPADFDRPGMIARLAIRIGSVAAGVTEHAEEGLCEWLEFLHGHERDTPLLLHAAAALEAWTLIDPLPHRPYIGPLIVAHWLRSRRRVSSHLMAVESGIRAHARKRRDGFSQVPHVRLIYWLKVVAEAANYGLAEVQRLDLARQVMSRHLEGRREDFRGQAVVELLLANPVVTAPMLAESLRMSQTSARRLIECLGPSVTEISGRARFRAWRA